MTDRKRTHAHDCWSWGDGHYDCAVREIERLRKMHEDAYQRGLQAGSRGLREMYDAIQAVKRQDAWGNTRLTEALMEAEERTERAEAENKRLREALARLITWTPSADTYRHLGFDPDAPMRVLEEARAALAQSEYHGHNPKSGEE